MNDATTARQWTVDPLIRIGILALPLGGALKLLGNIGTFDSVGYGVPQSTEATVAAGPLFFVGEFVGSVLPVVLGLFAAFAIFGYLAGRASRRLLTAALVCSTVGGGLVLAALGVINYAFPALAHSYLAGHGAAMDVLDGFFGWPWGAIMYPAVLAPIGTICFCVALWRSTSVPRVPVLAAALSSVLIAIPVPLHAIRLAGGLIGLAAGVWIALVVRSELIGDPQRSAS